MEKKRVAKEKSWKEVFKQLDEAKEIVKKYPKENWTQLIRESRDER